eukprot:GHRR01024626.1.p1 GENE.GHRR01024626.1~~GHRR01024626.1.p1  ORF type:complete len:231 (+),score=67.25 GHRR01024626.1:606-1298(+)
MSLCAGADLLERLHRDLQQQGIHLALCNPAVAVIELLERAGLPDALGRQWIFVRMHDAIQRCLRGMVAKGHSIKPTPAIDSAAVPPKQAAFIRNASVHRSVSTCGDAADIIAPGFGPLSPEELHAFSLIATQSAPQAIVQGMSVSVGGMGDMYSSGPAHTSAFQQAASYIDEPSCYQPLPGRPSAAGGGKGSVGDCVSRTAASPSLTACSCVPEAHGEVVLLGLKDEPSA